MTIRLIPYVFVCLCRKSKKKKKSKKDDSDSSSGTETTSEEGEEVPEVTTIETQEDKHGKTQKKFPRFFEGCQNVLPTDWQFEPDIPLVYLATTGYIFPPPRTETRSGIKVIKGDEEFMHEDTANNRIGQAAYDVEV